MNENAMMVVCQAIADPKMMEKYKAVLPPDVPLDRFTRVTVTAVQNNPAILECDRQSLYNSCVTAAQRGLLPDGKEGALVSFNTKDGNGGWTKKAQFMPMVGGIIKEMAKAGIKAHAVSIYANDQVRIWNDDKGQHFEHTPVVFGDRGERIGAVAWASDKDGRTYVEAMNMQDIAGVRARSKQKDKEGNPTGTWRDAPDRMEQKSALHRLRNRMAIVTEFDEEMDYEPSEQVEEKPETPATQTVATTKRPKGLRDAMSKAEEPHGEVIEAEPQDEAEVF